MKRVDLAIQAVGGARDRVRSLLVEAASAGDYSDLAVLGRLCQRLDEFVEAMATGQLPTSEALRAGTAQAPRGASAKRPRRARARKSPASGRGVIPARGNAVFQRENDELVKVGKSKGRDAKYEHRVSLRTTLYLAARLAAVGSSEKLVRMEDLLPLTHPSGETVPSYQAYVSLGWLKHEGLVRQHGRRGYTVADPETITAEAQVRFDQLSRHGTR